MKEHLVEFGKDGPDVTPLRLTQRTRTRLLTPGYLHFKQNETLLTPSPTPDGMRAEHHRICSSFRSDGSPRLPVSARPYAGAYPRRGGGGGAGRESHGMGHRMERCGIPPQGSEAGISGFSS